MPGKLLTVEQILCALSEAPRRIAESAVGLTPAQLRAAPSPGKWSANAVLAHLRACADVWGDCMATIINQDTPTIRAINPRTWIKETNYLEQEFQPSLQAFTTQRAALLRVLQALRQEAWSRSATVTGAGNALQRTVHFYAQWMVQHERPHVKQIQHIAARLRL